MNWSMESYLQQIKTRRIAFLGVGVSHRELIEQYAAMGADITVRDRRTREQLGETAVQLEQLGVKLRLGEVYLQELTEDIIFRTPGMRYFIPELEQARARGSVVTSEMELFFHLCPCRIFAVTGSDGKTTSTTLIAEMLRAQGYTVHLGGNIGTPLLPRIAQVHAQDMAVVELSSFQLISMRESPDVALVTNVAPNHLDMHRDMQEYIDAKRNLLLHQSAFSRTVLNADNAITTAMQADVRGDLYWFSRQAPVQRGAFLREDGMLVYRKDGQDTELFLQSDIKIPGMHNVENFLGVIAAVWGYVQPEIIHRVAKEFSGVEHRIEFVRCLDGVRWYNDSIASNPTRTIAGLNSFSQRLILIAGGYDKKIPFEPLADPVAQKVKLLILMGPTAEKIEKAVRSSSYYCPEQTRILHAENMQQAVQIARQQADAGDIVSLSPACASFDAYPNFEERGRHFKQLVQALAETEHTGGRA